jgi:serine O-acetyltransferase
MQKDFISKLFQEHQSTPKCPSPATVSNWFNRLLGVLFPGNCDTSFENEADLDAFLQNLKNDLSSILVCHATENIKDKNAVTEQFFNELPEIKSLLDKDVIGLYNGDPAAKNYAEVTRSYPGFYAIAAHRIAHLLYKMGVELIPRMISEHAHSHVGVDIHPGATIGEYFCIDHGTGVVIGETSNIGNNVKIYQGVTLGALSVAKEDAEKKRHPTIEDGVVIYAGATILGGRTVVGKDSIIGGSVWITRSVPAESKIYYKANNQ